MSALRDDLPRLRGRGITYNESNGTYKVTLRAYAKGGRFGRFQCVIVGGVAVKFAGLWNEAGGAHIRDKNGCAFINPLLVPAGDFRKGAGNL